MIIPILIVAAVVIFVIVLGRMIKRMSNRNGKYTSVNLLKWFLGGYILFLLCSILLSTLIFKGNEIEWKASRKELSMKSWDYFYQATLTGKIAEADESYIKKKWAFTFHNTRAKIRLMNGDNGNSIPIIAEVKNKKDGKIEVYQYSNEAFLTIAFKLKPMGIHLTGDTLYLTKPEPEHLKFSLFKKEFPITQFTGDSLEKYSTDFFRVENVLYLRIPRGLDLVSDMPIEKVHEER